MVKASLGGDGNGAMEKMNWASPGFLCFLLLPFLILKDEQGFLTLTTQGLTFGINEFNKIY